MAKEIETYIKLKAPGGTANPSGAVGPEVRAQLMVGMNRLLSRVTRKNKAMPLRTVRLRYMCVGLVVYSAGH